MIDTKKLLDQFLGAGGVQDMLAKSGLGDALGGVLGGGAAKGTSPRGSVPEGGPVSGRSAGLGAGGLSGSLGGLAGGALAGGLVSVLLGSKSARKIGGKAATYGGIALVGALAYTAYRNWQAKQEGTARTAEAAPAAGAGAPAGPAASAPLALPPPETPFHPAHAPGGENGLALTLLHAMIAAAKADGHIDAAERGRILGRLSAIGMGGEDTAFLEAELASPVDIDGLVREAATPEIAAEIYAASLLVITPDEPAERAYLDFLAARLRIDPGLKGELEAAVAAQMPAA